MNRKRSPALEKAIREYNRADQKVKKARTAYKVALWNRDVAEAEKEQKAEKTAT